MEKKVDNLVLYKTVKEEAKKKFKVWPSAYASGWMVREYKKRGGGFLGGDKKKDVDLHRWFLEEWINVCELPKIVPCGRPKSDLANYPYCRPRKRISAETPTTASELSARDIKARCDKKRRRPLERVTSATTATR